VTRRPDLDDRLETDLARGDLGAARRRLTSRVASGGYSPEALERVAELSLRMGDLAQAGRYAFLIERASPELERAREAFVTACGGEAGRVANELPHFSGSHDLSVYPEKVRARLEAAGVPAHWPPPWVRGPVGPISRWKVVTGCLVAGGVLGTAVFLVLRALTRVFVCP